MTIFALQRRALLGAVLASALPARAGSSALPVVASFSILADLTRQVGGNRVDVTTLVGLDGDAHAFEPTPQQARQLQQARVLVANGLGFETWLSRLKKTAGFKGREIVAARGVQPRVLAESHGHGHDGETLDPHAWQSVRNAILYVQNIAKGLAQADPSNAAHYRTRTADYTTRLKALDARIRERFEVLPAAHRSVVSTHDAFGYFAQAYGLRFVPVRGLSTEAEPSARDLARLVEQIRRERIHAIFIENMADPRLLQQLARETGATIGGRLYSDALSAAGGPAATYIDMMEANAAALFNALRATATASR